MSTNRDDLKAKLLAQAEAAIDKRLSDERLNGQMTLSDIEAVLACRKRIFVSVRWKKS